MPYCNVITKCGELIQMTKSQVDRGDGFKKNCITFVISMCLYANQRIEANYLILKALVDLSEATKLNGRTIY